MKIGLILIFVPFLLGLITSQAVSDNMSFEMPFSYGQEKISPHDRIDESQIFVYNDKVILQMKGASLAEYADTNSMDPLLDEGSNGIEIELKDENDVHVGDIVAYETSIGLIVHRIVEIGNDEKGKYFILKGDNNIENDPYKVRFNQIKYVLVGIIY